VYLGIMSQTDIAVPQWQPCLGVDLGKPLGPMTSATYGKNGDWTIWVHTREFAHGTVVLRCMDGYDRTDFDDTSAVTVPVTGKVLNADGTVGPVVSSVQLRNADSAIVMK
jgi:hypothetical protein